MELTSSLVPEIKAEELLCHVSFLEFWPWPFVACLTLMLDCLTTSSYANSCAKAHVAYNGKLMSWGKAWKGGKWQKSEHCLLTLLESVARH